MKVCVITVTYNQEQYIAQAIEGVLQQKTDFPVELIIGEDCSPDHTRDIVKSYQGRYPERIRAIIHPSNVGGAENFRTIYDSADGDYTAMCEGDDYWTDPYKLQKQVTFLETHPEYSFSFHNVNVLDQQSGVSKPHFPPGSMMPKYTLANLLGGNFIQSCSVVYRRSNLPVLPQWLQKLPIGDWPIHMLHAEHGPVHCIDEIMGVYRILSSGNWANRPLAYRLERSIRTALQFDTALNRKYASRIGATVVNWYNTLITECQNRKEIRSAFDYMLQALATVTEPALHSNYLTRYLSLFIDTIATLVESGREQDALTLYFTHADRLPFVSELRKLDTIMTRLKEKTGTFS